MQHGQRKGEGGGKKKRKKKERNVNWPGCERACGTAAGGDTGKGRREKKGDCLSTAMAGEGKRGKKGSTFFDVRKSGLNIVGELEDGRRKRKNEEGGRAGGQ